ncbi:MAG TPA: STAS domain-containing protein [Solirubrobacteraceae bacterium]|nr:STAS domain-containing protein [Solirubrobacteraceae bacterium]
MKDHTLVLTGELDRFSAPVLETEVERLCETGVLALTLDLRGLERIDAAGVAVIVHRCGWCERHGCEVTLLTDAPALQRALALAGAGDRVPHDSLTGPARPERSERLGQPFPLEAN